MEESTLCHGNKEQEVEEEEYVLIDLDAVLDQVHIPPNAPYVLSGLDTLNPILIIDDKIKLIGEYTETIGTCLIFSETGEPYLSINTSLKELDFDIFVAVNYCKFIWRKILYHLTAFSTQQSDRSVSRDLNVDIQHASLDMLRCSSCGP